VTELAALLDTVVLKGNTTTANNEIPVVNPYASCIWINNPTPFSATTTYWSCNTADIIVCTWIWLWYTVAACNVWTDNAATSSTDSNWYWELFQWWNNEWLKNASTNSTQVTVTVTWSTYNGNGIFIKGYQNWNTVENLDLWWNITDTDLARQWPCISWYHVPSNQEWINLIIAGWWANWTEIFNDLKMPLSGNRDWYNATTSSWVNGRYHSSTPHNANWTKRLGFTATTSISMGTDWYAEWFSVRCFKN
jgi:hypothetical protein